MRRIADLGCGDAAIAKELGGVKKVYSFDLVAVNERVTACDIAHVPLKDGAVQVGGLGPRVLVCSVWGSERCVKVREIAASDAARGGRGCWRVVVNARCDALAVECSMREACTVVAV